MCIVKINPTKGICKHPALLFIDFLLGLWTGIFEEGNPNIGKLLLVRLLVNLYMNLFKALSSKIT